MTQVNHFEENVNLAKRLKRNLERISLKFDQIRSRWNFKFQNEILCFSAKYGAFSVKFVVSERKNISHVRKF
jgi:hypothetical protein